MKNNYMAGIDATKTLSNINAAEKLVAIGKALREWHKDAFSLNDINKIMSTTTLPDDFNAFEVPFMSYRDVSKAVAAAEKALDDKYAPWLIISCECGEPIILSHDELTWRRKYDLPMPTFCQSCLEKYRKGVTILEEDSNGEDV